MSRGKDLEKRSLLSSIQDDETAVSKGGKPPSFFSQLMSGMTGAIFNLTNTIIGAGVLTLPYAFAKAGYLLGGGLLMLACILSSYSLVTLTLSSVATGKFSYKDIAALAYGRTMSVVSQVCVVLYTLGSCIGYTVLIGDFLPRIMSAFLGEDSDSILVNRTFLILVVIVCIVLPMAFLRNVSSLSFGSFLAIIFVTYTLIVIGLHCKVLDAEMVKIEANYDLFLAFPLMVVSFTAHYNALSIYEELTPRRPKRMYGVVAVSCLVCLSFYATFGILGYSQFGSATPSDILNGYADHFVNGESAYDRMLTIQVIAARLSLTLTLIFSFPLVHFALRKNILSLIVDEPSGWHYTVSPLVVFSVTTTVGLLVPNIGTVLGFNGAIFGVLIVYVFPGLFYLKLLPREASRVHVVLCLVLVILGIVLGLIGVGVNVVAVLDAGGADGGSGSGSSESGSAMVAAYERAFATVGSAIKRSFL